MNGIKSNARAPAFAIIPPRALFQYLVTYGTTLHIFLPTTWLSSAISDMSLLSDAPTAPPSCSVADTEFRKARCVSMLQSQLTNFYVMEKKMVRPPGFEPGTRGWKPLVITPSLQAPELGGRIASLNRFGLLRNLKSESLLGLS